MKQIYLFTNTHLPIDGWLQGCVICTEITGMTKKINKYKLPFYQLCNKTIRNKEVYGYICNKCIKFKKEKFYTSCIYCLDKYIN